MKNEIEKALEFLSKGELVVYPTDTLYGLGADVFNRKAVKKIYEAKRRPLSMPISIAVSSIEEIEKYAFMNKISRKVAEEFLPGALTLILKKKKIIPDIVAKDKVALRIPSNEVAIKLAENMPITATSANIHGGENPWNIEIAKKQLGEKVAMYIDAGNLKNVPSTIVDLSEGKIKIVREGAIKKEEIYDRI
ncbi:MAG TPA: threonylcarbamoyl-AMP synthase [Thermoplasmatales archaeon]|nr:threonylcarbamoyl-AMP synthase [Thermoplasmatales archaeon]